VKPLLASYVAAVRNGPHGLFSRGDLERLEAHALDGATGAPVLLAQGVRSFVDIGSGGGVPGLPLAAELPGVEAHLVESQGWKCEFLDACARELGLESSVTVHHARAEDAVGVIGRETLDAGVARAVAAPTVVAEYLSPYVRIGGLLLLWSTTAQAADLDPEVGQRRLGLGEPDIIPVESPLRDSAVFIAWPKVAECDATIPRRTGVAGRKPLR
jgi:16S rRNA (guanine527-N7)-methyltransferase